MNEQDIVKYFSQMIWKETKSSVKENIKFDMLKNGNRILILFEGEYSFVLQFLSHYYDVKILKDDVIDGKNAVVIRLGDRENRDTLCIRNSGICVEECKSYGIQDIVIIKPHIHSLDSLYLETLLYDIEDEIKSFIYAYEADKLSMIIDVERHVQSLQLYWNMLEWFEKSELKQVYIRKYGNLESD